MKSLKQLLSKVKSGKMDKKTAKDLERLVTRGDGFVVITKSKKNGYNRFHANFVGERGIDVVPHMRDFRPKKGVYKPEHAMTDIDWKDVKDIYMENKMNLKLEELVGKPITLEQFDEAAGKKDACYHKVRARYDVWPSAYASGALVKCRKVGAKNWGNKSKKENVSESYDIWSDDLKFGYTMEGIVEAEYQGRKVKLGKPMQGDVKKFKVYVKNPQGNVVKVNFGQGGKAKGGTMKIRKSNPNARKNFRARHNCDNPGPRHKARYWSCRKW